jgi:predicted GNAT superfamily acetyltransferase
LLISWDLRSDEAVTCAAGTPLAPVVRESGDVSVAVPEDIERLRREHPADAQSWRTRVRDELTALLDAGGRIIGFDRGEGYLVRPGKEQR